MSEEAEKTAREIAGRIVTEAFNSPSLSYPMIARALAAAHRAGKVEGLKESQEVIREGVDEQAYGMNGPFKVRRSKSMMEMIAAIAACIAEIENEGNDDDHAK
jgi:hypothetical protein